MMDKNYLFKIFRSVLDQDRAPIVLCDLNHIIVYMNAAAVENYHKYGGIALMGRSVMDCHPAPARKAIERVVAWFAISHENNIVHTFYNEKKNKDVYMVALRDEDGMLIGYYEKHEFRDKETMKLYDI